MGIVDRRDHFPQLAPDASGGGDQDQLLEFSLHRLLKMLRGDEHFAPLQALVDAAPELDSQVAGEGNRRRLLGGFYHGRGL